MKVTGIIYESIADGLGLRTVIFVSGCIHHCNECHNKESQDFSNGKLLDDNLLEEIFQNIEKNTLIAGITLSGGDPLHEDNANGSLYIIKKFKERFPRKNVWIYTGYTLEKLKKTDYFKNFLPYINYIVDGKYIKEYRDVTLAFRGSTNQKIYSIKQNKNFLMRKFKPYIFIDNTQLFDDLYKDFKIKK